MPTFPFAHRLAHLDAYNAAMQARNERDWQLRAGDHDEPKQAKGATAAGDERKLRGIPAIARGVQGAIEGTRP